MRTIGKRPKTASDLSDAARHVEIVDLIRRRYCYLDVTVAGVRDGPAKDGGLSVAQLNALKHANRSVISKLDWKELYGKTRYLNQYPVRQTKRAALRYLDELVGDGVDIGLTHVQITTEIIADDMRSARRIARWIAYHLVLRWRGFQTLWIERRFEEIHYYFARESAARNFHIYASTSKVDGKPCARLEVERSYFSSLDDIKIGRPADLLRADITALFAREVAGRLRSVADPIEFDRGMDRMIEMEADELLSEGQLDRKRGQAIPSFDQFVTDLKSRWRKRLFRFGDSDIETRDEGDWQDWHEAPMQSIVDATRSLVAAGMMQLQVVKLDCAPFLPRPDDVTDTARSRHAARRSPHSNH